jgi:hypothetical protein
MLGIKYFKMLSLFCESISLPTTFENSHLATWIVSWANNICFSHKFSNRSTKGLLFTYDTVSDLTLSVKWTPFYALYSGCCKRNSLWPVSLRSGSYADIAYVWLPLQSATPPHWANSPMVVRAIPASTRRRTARRLPNRIQIMFWRAATFIQL